MSKDFRGASVKWTSVKSRKHVMSYMIPAKALKSVQEDVRRKIVFALQQMDLLQCHGHRCTIFGALTTCEPGSIH